MRTKISRPRVAVVATIAAVAVLAAACSSGKKSSSSSTGSSGQPTVTLNVALGASTLLYAPVYLAASQGYFAQEGLNVKQTQVVAAASIQALTSGSVDLAFVASESYLVAKEKGITPIAIQANNTGNVNSYLMATNSYLAKKGVKTTDPLSTRLAAMKGAKIGYTAPGAISQINAEWMLQQAGISTKDVTLIAVGGGTAADAAMERGSIDMELATPPDVQTLEASGASVLVDGLKEFPLMASQPYSVVLAAPSWLQKNSAVAKRFTAAISKAIAYINKSTTQAASALQSKFPDVKSDQLLAGLQSMVPTYTQGGVMTEAMWQNAIQLGVTAGVLTGGSLDSTEGKLWTNQYIGSAS